MDIPGSSRPFLMTALITLLLIGAGEAAAFPAATALVVRLVNPAETDPAIDDWLQPHYVLLDPVTALKGKLFVFLPGSYASPAGYQSLLTLAAAKGYHAIGLRYPNSWTVFDFCFGTIDLDCFGNVMLETLDGADHSPHVAVSRANSIENRLTRLLQYLDAHYPGEGWGGFLDGEGPRWGDIVIAGHSQGGAEAGFIALQFPVYRLGMFGAPGDHNTLHQPAGWIRQPHQTPVERYYAFCHRNEAVWDFLQDNWPLLGMSVFGGPVNGDATAPDFMGSHEIYTLVPPPIPGTEHSSTVADEFTPRDETGRPVHEPIWIYVACPPGGGDLNLDGRVDALDCRMLAGYFADNLSGFPAWPGQADLDNDAGVDLPDMVLLARKIDIP